MLTALSAPDPGSSGGSFIRRIKGGERLQCVVQSVQPFWFAIHYHPKFRSIACKGTRTPAGQLMDPRECRGCKDNSPWRKKGYLWVFALISGRREWLEITPTCWDCMTTQCGAITDMRGYDLVISRGDKDKSRFFVEVKPVKPGVDVSKYSDPPDPVKAILSIMDI